MGNKPLPSDKIEQIKTLLEAQYPTTQVATLVGVSRQTIQNYKNKLGINVTPIRQRSLSEFDIIDMIQKFKDGVKIKDLMRHYQSTHVTIRRILKQHGVNIRQHRTKPLDRKQMVIGTEIYQLIVKLASLARMTRRNYVAKLIREAAQRQGILPPEKAIE